MALTHPDDGAHVTADTHPIPSDIVHEVSRDNDVSYDTLHDLLVQVQQAFEATLSVKKSFIYDPLDLSGKARHVFKRDYDDTPYRHVFYREDGYFTLRSERGTLMAVASHLAVEELGRYTNDDGPTEQEYYDRINELKSEVDLSSYTESDLRAIVGRDFDLKRRLSNLFEYEVDSPEVKAVCAAHSVAYERDGAGHSEHGESGVVVGMPGMFMQGMRAEQRLFSELASSDLTPTQLVDAYGNRVSYQNPSKWGAKRGVSASAVSQNRTKAQKTIQDSYPEMTIAEQLRYLRVNTEGE